MLLSLAIFKYLILYFGIFLKKDCSVTNSLGKFIRTRTANWQICYETEAMACYDNWRNLPKKKEKKSYATSPNCTAAFGRELTQSCLLPPTKSYHLNDFLILL